MPKVNVSESTACSPHAWTLPIRASSRVLRMRHSPVWDHVFAGRSQFLQHLLEALGGAPLSPILRGKDGVRAHLKASRPEDRVVFHKLLCQGAEVMVTLCAIAEWGHLHISTQLHLTKNVKNLL